MATTAKITGLILAGGAGRRMGHRDKGLIDWRGKPLVAHVSDVLRPQVQDLIISCNRHTSRYKDFAPTVVPDIRDRYQGPLAGLEAASTYIPTEYVAVAACDMPLLPPDFVGRLLVGLTESGSVEIAFARDGQRDHYLCALMRRDCLESLSRFLDEGQRSVQAWYRTHSCVAVDFSDCAAAFRNYNLPGDLSETNQP